MDRSFWYAIQVGLAMWTFSTLMDSAEFRRRPLVKVGTRIGVVIACAFVALYVLSNLDTLLRYIVG